MTYRGLAAVLIVVIVLVMFTVTALVMWHDVGCLPFQSGACT